MSDYKDILARDVADALVKELRFNDLSSDFWESLSKYERRLLVERFNLVAAERIRGPWPMPVEKAVPRAVAYRRGLKVSS